MANASAAHPSRAAEVYAYNCTRWLRQDVAQQIVNEGNSAAQGAIETIEEMPHAQWMWDAIEELRQTMSWLRDIAEEENFQSLSISLISLRCQIIDAADKVGFNSDNEESESVLRAHASTLDALSRIAPAIDPTK